MNNRHSLTQQNNLLSVSSPHNASQIVEHEDGTASYIAKSAIFGPFESREQAVHLFQQERMVSQ